MSIMTYTPPVSQLLTLGDPTGKTDWRHYGSLGLRPEHIPELIRMVLDEELHWADSDSAAVWAPLHAWRALGQLRAEAAIEPLLTLLRRIDEHEDDWVSEDLPVVFGLIGAAAIPSLANYLANAEYPLFARVAAAQAFRRIGEKHPATRAACADKLMQQLEKYADNDRSLNAFLVGALLDLSIVEAVPLMERAFAAGSVDVSVNGDWEEVQISLGLKSHRDTPRPHFLAQEYGDLTSQAASPKPRRQHRHKKKN